MFYKGGEESVSEGLAFGEIVIQGKSYRDDVFLGYGEPQPWQRIEPHQVVLEDVQELIPSDVCYVVFGTGFTGRMVVSPVVAEHLHKKGIACVEQKTPQALETYEKLLSKGEKAVAFLHLGC